MNPSVIFVDVDTQTDFISPEGNLYVSGAEKLTSRLERLTRFAVEKEIPILASVDAHAEDDPEFEQFPPHCVKGKPGQEKIPETTAEKTLVVENKKQDIPNPFEGDFQQVILEKQDFTFFDNVNATKLIEKLSGRRFIVYGVAQDICVRAAALGLRQMGQTVDLVEDATAPVDPEDGRKTLEELRNKGVRFFKTEEILEALQ
jgi:nicotinamidase/pyrazinamidase